MKCAGRGKFKSPILREATPLQKPAYPGALYKFRDAQASAQVIGQDARRGKRQHWTELKAVRRGGPETDRFPQLMNEDNEMTMTFPTGGTASDFKRVPAGSHIAVCNLIADCGMQPGSQLYPNPKHKLYVRFEIPAERVEYEKDGQTIEGPMTLGSFYTASMNEKATLRKHLESWRGRSFTDEEAARFDVSAILGKACMLSVVHSESGGKTYANIASIGAMPKGMSVPKAENTLLYYDDSSPAVDLDKLPKWLHDKINGQLTGKNPVSVSDYSNTVADDEKDDQLAYGGFTDDDIPFAPHGKHAHWIA